MIFILNFTKIINIFYWLFVISEEPFDQNVNFLIAAASLIFNFFLVFKSILGDFEPYKSEPYICESCKRRP